MNKGQKAIGNRPIETKDRNKRKEKNYGRATGKRARVSEH
jgi:hypothetical protein